MQMHANVYLEVKEKLHQGCNDTVDLSGLQQTRAEGWPCSGGGRVQTQPPLFVDGSKDPATVELVWSWLPETPPLCRGGPLAHHKQPSPQEAGVAAVEEHGVHIPRWLHLPQTPPNYHACSPPLPRMCHCSVRDATAASPRSCSLLHKCCCNSRGVFPTSSNL